MTATITKWLDQVGQGLSPGASHLLKALCVHCRPEDGLVLDPEDPTGFPDMEFFRRVCSLSRSSIFRYRKELLEHGLIQDSGRRGGKTGRIVVYRVAGALCCWNPDLSPEASSGQEDGSASGIVVGLPPWDSPSPRVHGGDALHRDLESPSDDDRNSEPNEGESGEAPAAPGANRLVVQVIATVGNSQIHLKAESGPVASAQPKERVQSSTPEGGGRTR